MRALIPDGLNSALDKIVAKCFEGNRIADRGMSILSVKFVMNKTEKILHERLAHLFPALADVVSEFQNSRNNLTVYGVTPRDSSDYDSPLAFFETMLGFMMELEGLIIEVIGESFSEDTPTFAFLSGFLVDKIVPVTAQCLLLVDKAEKYNDWMLFDHNIEDFVVL